jgi:hypothetical protein
MATGAKFQASPIAGSTIQQWHKWIELCTGVTYRDTQRIREYTLWINKCSTGAAFAYPPATQEENKQSVLKNVNR